MVRWRPRWTRQGKAAELGMGEGHSGLVRSEVAAALWREERPRSDMILVSMLSRRCASLRETHAYGKYIIDKGYVAETVHGKGHGKGWMTNNDPRPSAAIFQALQPFALVSTRS